MLTEVSQIEAYLSDTYTEYDAVEISGPPTIPILKWTTTLPDHSGFTFFNDTWYAIKGSPEGIPAFWVPRKSNLFIYSIPTLNDLDTSYPTPETILSASAMTRNFLVSNYGLTRYFASPQEQRSDLLSALERFNNRQTPNFQKEYLKFLADLQIKFHRIPWSLITEEIYQSLL